MGNLFGKKGGDKHQEVQKKELQKLEQEYQTSPDIEVDKEVPVFTPKSKTHKQRIVDIAAYGVNYPTRYIKIVQIGKTNQDGTPVKREKKRWKISKNIRVSK